VAKGLDYAFYPHPSVHAIQSYGAEWVGRYVSASPANDTNGKNLLPAEKAELTAHGLKIILFVEEGAADMKGGRAAGVARAQHAVAVAKALGMDGIPFYYCADWDATEHDQAAINAYLDGATSVHGLARTGIYGGYYAVKRALDAGKATYSCQTIAWSGGQWDHRANIRQGPAVTVGGASCDADESWTRPDYGQWPRPAPPPPKEPPVTTPAKPPAPPGQWNNPDQWTWKDVLVIGAGLDGKIHLFRLENNTWVKIR
jgi:Rv2525c-like, glycoside hydrolase-like domain